MKKLKVSCKLRKEILKHRKSNPLFWNTNFYLDENKIIVERSINLFSKILSTFAFPIFIILGGFSDTCNHMKDIWKNELTFTDNINSDSEYYDLILNQNI